VHRLRVCDKTDLGMCPQSLALESTLAENPGVGWKRYVDTTRATGQGTSPK